MELRVRLIGSYSEGEEINSPKHTPHLTCAQRDIKHEAFFMRERAVDEQLVVLPGEYFFGTSDEFIPETVELPITTVSYAAERAMLGRSKRGSGMIVGR